MPRLFKGKGKGKNGKGVKGKGKNADVEMSDAAYIGYDYSGYKNYSNHYSYPESCSQPFSRDIGMLSEISTKISECPQFVSPSFSGSIGMLAEIGTSTEANTSNDFFKPKGKPLSSLVIYGRECFMSL